MYQAITEHDLTIFLKHELGVIRHKHALATNWPDELTIKRLVHKAGGLFIWAITTCRFINKGKRFTPKRLSLILEGKSSTKEPEEKLNEIYVSVLRNSISDEFDDQEKEEQYEKLRATLGAVVILFSSISTISLANSLYICKEDIGQTLDDLHSVLEVPKDQIQPIRLHHPSFRDFLLDKQRCRNPHFWVDERELHGALADCCMRLMSDKLKKDICDLHQPGALASEVKGGWIG